MGAEELMREFARLVGRALARRWAQERGHLPGAQAGDQGQRTKRPRVGTAIGVKCPAQRQPVTKAVARHRIELRQ